MYKLSEPFDSQAALESFESRVLASETKFDYLRVASRNVYSLRLARTCEYSLRASGGTLTRGWYCMASEQELHPMPYARTICIVFEL